METGLGLEWGMSECRFEDIKMAKIDKNYQSFY